MSLGLGIVVAAHGVAVAKPELPESVSEPPEQPGEGVVNPAAETMMDEGTEEVAMPKGLDLSGEEPPRGESPALDAADPTATAPKTTPVATSFATLRFRNDVGSKFRLLEAWVIVDGNPARPTSGDALASKEYIIYQGALRPGQHAVSVRAVYQGERRGPFSYMKGYKLNVRSAQLINVPVDREHTFTIVAKEKPGINVPLEKRLGITLVDGGGPAAGTSSAR